MYSLLWQVIKNGMVVRLEGQYIGKLLSRSDSIASTARSADDLHAETSLLRWINLTLNTPGAEACPVTDFKDCLKDGVIYGKLIDTLFPGKLAMEKYLEMDEAKRAEEIVKAGQYILGKVCILEPDDILKVWIISSLYF